MNPIRNGIRIVDSDLQRTAGADGITTHDIALESADPATHSSVAAPTGTPCSRTTGMSRIGSGAPVAIEPSSAVLSHTTTRIALSPPPVGRLR